MWKRITIVGVLTTAALYVTKKYFGGTACRCINRVSCKAVVITGATSGIGKALAYELAKRGAVVILGCRDLSTANHVCDEIAEATGNPSVYPLPLDLRDLESVRQFAKSVENCEHDIFALVNNAGVFYFPQQDTKDGFDETFQVNYLGGFVLTGLLSNLLFKDAPGRVINVSSQAHHIPRVPPTFLSDTVKPNANFTNQLSLFELYGQSKLCVNLFTRKLSQLLKDTGVTVVSVDPGNVETRIYRRFPLLTNPILRALQWPIRQIVVKSPLEGAQSLLHAVNCEQVTSGAYIRECCESQPSDLSLQDDLADKLWQCSLKWGELQESQFLPPH